MKFLLSHTGIINKKNLVEVSNWNGFADLMIAHKNEDKAQYPLAEIVETMMEITISDNDMTKEEEAEVHWSQFTDSVASDVFHCNAPFVFNGRLKQITSFPDSVYSYTEALVVQQCKAYFDKEEFIKPEEVKKNKGNQTSTKVKASFPGVYPSGIKSNPNRFVAYYRKDMRTVKIGFFNNEAEAIQAKKDLLNNIS